MHVRREVRKRNTLRLARYTRGCAPSPHGGTVYDDEGIAPYALTHLVTLLYTVPHRQGTARRAASFTPRVRSC